MIIRKVLPEEANEYAALHIACWQSAYRGTISEGYIQNMLADIDKRAERCRQDLTTPGEWLDQDYTAHYSMQSKLRIS